MAVSHEFRHKVRSIPRGRLLPLFLVLILAACGDDEPETTARIIIDSTPEQGAMVKVNNVEAGVTPYELTGMPEGRILVQLLLDGYKKKSEIVDVPAQGERHITLELQRIVGFLTLESDPTGASVFIDGLQYAGNTPLREYGLPVGEHTYDLRMENYVTTQETIEIEEDYRYTRSHILKPRDAELRITSLPTGGRIWVNDQIQNEVTPARLVIAPGSYTISVHATGFIQEDRLVQLEPNARVDEAFSLKEGDVPAGMVLVPAGEFIFGKEKEAPDERPEVSIFVEVFYIDKNEVTNEEFATVFPGHAFDSVTAKMPVTGVTWKQARDFAGRVGKRLPAEVEWEKAARGTEGLEYPWGARFEAAYCNSQETSEAGARVGPRKVGTYRDGMSPYGCMDMAGNVYEWTSDWYQAYEGNTEITQEYGQVYRVLRGGSYLSDKFHVRSARRHYDREDSVREDYGFRCVMEVPEEIS